MLGGGPPQPDIVGRPHGWLDVEAGPGAFEDDPLQPAPGFARVRQAVQGQPHREQLALDGWCDEGGEEAFNLASVVSGGSDGAHSSKGIRWGGSGGALQVPCQDRVRHTLLSLRLGKAYIAYCVLCFALSSVACASTLGRAAGAKVWRGDPLAMHRWQPWESASEFVIGLIVCAETMSNLWLTGRREFVRDCWCVFDATVVVLTLLSWCLLALRRAVLVGEGMFTFDLPLLALRFVLQPCRVVAMASMTRRVRRMQQSTVDIAFDVLENVPETPPMETPRGRILSPALESEIRSHLPAWCRYREWHLSYSPAVHGTSMRTFFRLQAADKASDADGANVVVVRDAAGGIFGGFVPESWKVCAKGYYGSTDCFVFSVKPGEAPRFYHAVGQEEEVLLWGDPEMFSLAGALIVRQDFERGSSAACPSFASPCLSAEGPDFAVGVFECWRLGGPPSPAAAAR